MANPDEHIFGDLSLEVISPSCQGAITPVTIKPPDVFFIQLCCACQVIFFQIWLEKRNPNGLLQPPTRKVYF